MNWALVRNGILSSILHKSPQVPLNPLFSIYFPRIATNIICPYFSFLHPKTSLESHPLHNRIQSNDSSSGSSSSCYFEPNPVHKNQSLSNSTIGSFSNYYLISYSYHRNPLNCSLVHPFSQSLCCFRSFSSDGTLTCSNNGGLKKGEIGFCEEFDLGKRDSDYALDESPNIITEIVDVIVRNEDDMECKLNLIASDLRVKSQVALKCATEIFCILNSRGISGLRFFSWMHSISPDIRKSGIFCSMIIDHCGWLGDYETMVSLLKEFQAQNICLNRKAFQFLPVFGVNKTLLINSVKRVTSALSQAGGSCYGSGVHELVGMFCSIDLFEMAKFVIEITEPKVSYYDILVNEMCERGRIQEAHNTICDMVELGLECDAKLYNYILSSLCKIGYTDKACRLLEEMKEKGVLPDIQTYELFIHSFCSHGKLNRAYQLFNQMVSEGLEPRTNTHVLFVKACFGSEQYNEAYKYVIDSSVKYYNSSIAIYSLLARLHMKKGDVNTALKIMIEMMEKGLKPDHKVYKMITKWLSKHGRIEIASDLKSRYSVFVLEGNRKCEVN